MIKNKLESLKSSQFKSFKTASVIESGSSSGPDPLNLMKHFEGNWKGSHYSIDVEFFGTMKSTWGWTPGEAHYWEVTNVKGSGFYDGIAIKTK